MADLISMYMHGLVAFWRGMFGGGVLQLLVLGFLFWWFFCRRGGRCSCPHCGCWCGHCKCDEVRMEHTEAEPEKKAGRKKGDNAE